MPESQVWLVTGTSTGIGREIVLAGLAAGHKVIATARSAAKIKDLGEKGAYTIELDVSAPAAELEKGVKQALAAYGHIDVLVNNAAQIMFGTIEEASEQDVMRIFQTNLFGPLTLIRLLLPHMRERKSGTIVNIGSIGGTIIFPGLASYHGTKFALTGYTETLHNEVKHLGIRAVYVELGDFRTEILDSNVKMLTASGKIAEYYTPGSAASITQAGIAELTGNQPGDPKKAAETIVRVCSGKDPRGIPQRLVLGSDAAEKSKAKFKALTENVEKWEDVAKSTDY
ncbi:NAD(P)-binding protein [Neolentinus lepideus HHB14362 ss-1]|uniref:NAD(P)-binding protein n=1 Tax=Neolentinus lepideus HHB14362 ss-1 TaxID=1314782 RepID=A0A165RG58_9AGAM|nr:NAD(P)-binding protein [Neolentinus lepideus HHB14362 ss-1]